MAQDADLPSQIEHSLVLMRDKLGIRAADLRTAIARGRRRLPHGVRKSARQLAEAEPLLAHPRLRQTFDHGALAAAADRLIGHLDGIDVGDRRKGWWLGMLGGLAFNLLAFAALLIAVLVWRGFL